MKLLLQGWLLALVLIVELVGLVALAKHYYTQTTTETPPPAAQKNFAIVTSADGEGYQWVEWDAASPSSCGVWGGVQRESDGSGVEANSFSEAEAQECRVHIRPYLATTTRQPGVVRRAGGHRAEQPTSEDSSSTHLGE